MDPAGRQSILDGLEAADVDANVRAAKELHERSTEADIPWLLELLKHESFFVRESAAWPLAELAGYNYLPQLFASYQRGFDEGHDNDGFSAALIECASLHLKETRDALRPLIQSKDEQLRDNATWLLEFCGDA
jgi:HEAT repeat protein